MSNWEDNGTLNNEESRVADVEAYIGENLTFYEFVKDLK